MKAIIFNNSIFLRMAFLLLLKISLLATNLCKRYIQSKLQSEQLIILLFIREDFLQ